MFSGKAIIVAAVIVVAAGMLIYGLSGAPSRPSLESGQARSGVSNLSDENVSNEGENPEAPAAASLTVDPTNVTVPVAHSAPFVVTKNGRNPGPGFTASLSPNLGTIEVQPGMCIWVICFGKATITYTAPNTLPSGQTQAKVTLTATNRAGDSGTAQITVTQPEPPAVSLRLQPDSANVTAGGSPVQLALQWDNGTGWANVPGNVSASFTQTPSNVGTISQNLPYVTYTPPKSIGQATTTVTISVTVGSLQASAQITVSPSGGGGSNAAPVVSAGPDQTIIFPAPATLKGAVTDDGLPNPPGRVTVTWSEVSGPGTVTFADSSALSTTVTFSQTGAYLLKLSAFDGALTGTDTLTVTVNPAQPPPPTGRTCTVSPAAITVPGSLNAFSAQAYTPYPLTVTFSPSLTGSKVAIIASENYVPLWGWGIRYSSGNQPVLYVVSGLTQGTANIHLGYKIYDSGTSSSPSETGECNDVAATAAPTANAVSCTLSPAAIDGLIGETTSANLNVAFSPNLPSGSTLLYSLASPAYYQNLNQSLESTGQGTAQLRVTVPYDLTPEPGLAGHSTYVGEKIILNAGFAASVPDGTTINGACNDLTITATQSAALSGLILSPQNVTLNLGQTQQFKVVDASGNPYTGAVKNWQMTPFYAPFLNYNPPASAFGSLTQGGLYTAPQVYPLVRGGVFQVLISAQAGTGNYTIYANVSVK